MTNEEIKNGLAVCANDFCDGCSYYEFNNCYNKLKLDAQACIIEQEKEIERLKAKNEELEENIDMLIKEQKGDYNFEIKQAKIDVLNELKGKCHNYYPSVDHYCCSVKAVTLSDINNIIKELEK